MYVLFVYCGSGEKLCRDVCKFLQLILRCVFGGQRTVPPGYPPGLRFQTEDEKNHLGYHKCRDGGEAYSAAYLTTREHMVEHNTNYSLGWVNCEMASFIMMSPAKDMNKEKDGQILQSLDVLDMAVIHLSAYERSQRKHSHRIKQVRAHALHARAMDRHQQAHGHRGNGNGRGPPPVPGVDSSIGPVLNATKLLQSHFRSQNRPGAPPRFDGETAAFLNRTVVVMPFLGTDYGAGHSDLSNRYSYLHTCFWSVHGYFNNVVVSVKSPEDFEYIRSSGLPVFDVLLNEGLPKSASLPVATVQHTSRKLASGLWDFDFVYYTESDQILLMRHIADMYRHLQARPRRMFIPHRLMPYPTQVLEASFRRTATSGAQSEGAAWEDIHCCIPRQNCVNRKEWIPLANTSVVVSTVFGLNVPLGNSNFLLESYRACHLLTSDQLYPDPAVRDGDSLAERQRRYCP